MLPLVTDAPESYIPPLKLTSSTVNVNVSPGVFFNSSESNDTIPLISVIPESMSFVAPLQLPDTVAPMTGFPEASTMVAVAVA